jgi:hypothetical protein
MTVQNEDRENRNIILGTCIAVAIVIAVVLGSRARRYRGIPRSSAGEWKLPALRRVKIVGAFGQYAKPLFGSGFQVGIADIHSASVNGAWPRTLMEYAG